MVSLAADDAEVHPDHSHLTECIYQSVLGSQLPHKIVDYFN